MRKVKMRKKFGCPLYEALSINYLNSCWCRDSKASYKKVFLRNSRLEISLS